MRAHLRADPDRQQQIEAHDPQRQPERPVRRGQGDEHVAPAEAGERIDPHRRHMHAHENERRQRHEAMHLVGDQARPARALPTQGERQAQRDGQGQQEIRDQTTRAGHILDHRVPHPRTHATPASPVGAGQPPVVRQAPLSSTSRPGSP